MPTCDSHPAGTPGWIDLATTDAAGAKEFYRGLFGWEWEDVPALGGMTYSMSSLNGRLVAGMAPITPEMGDIPTVWNTHFFCDSADETHAAAVAAGGTSIVPPTDIMDSGRMAVVVDDQGARFGLWEPRAHKGMGVKGEAGAHSWSELIAPDLDKAAAFYGAVFGWGVEDAPSGEGPDYKLWTRDGGPVAGLMPPPSDEVPNCWTVYFGTDDAGRTAAQVSALGGQIMMGPMPTPGGDLVVAQDPQGGVFSAIRMTAQFAVA